MIFSTGDRSPLSFVSGHFSDGRSSIRSLEHLVQLDQYFCSLLVCGVHELC